MAYRHLPRDPRKIYIQKQKEVLDVQSSEMQGVREFSVVAVHSARSLKLSSDSGMQFPQPKKSDTRK
jgi:hypothetical protein